MQCRDMATASFASQFRLWQQTRQATAVRLHISSKVSPEWQRLGRRPGHSCPTMYRKIRLVCFVCLRGLLFEIGESDFFRVCDNMGRAFVLGYKPAE